MYTSKWWIKLLSPLLMLIIDSLQYSNCYVLFSGLIIHKECRKSLWPLGSWVKTRAKFCLPIVIAWLLLERAAPMLLRSYRPLNRDVNAGLRWQWQRKGIRGSTNISHVHHIHWLWVFATLKYHILILKQPNGALIMRREQGMPTADTKKRCM